MRVSKDFSADMEQFQLPEEEGKRARLRVSPPKLKTGGGKKGDEDDEDEVEDYIEPDPRKDLGILTLRLLQLLCGGHEIHLQVRNSALCKGRLEFDRSQLCSVELNCRNIFPQSVPSPEC